MGFYQGACAKSKIDRKYLALLMNTFFFHLTHPPSLLDPDHFRFEKGAAVPLLTAKLAVEDKMLEFQP